MADIYRFPNGGYEVVVCKKQDILDCIDKNITDKEVLLDIIKQCEKDAAEFIKQGRWTGIPFIGNIRIPKSIQIMNSPEQQELIKEARETLDTDQYMMFRKQLNIDISKKVKNERYYNYITSIAINKNRGLFKTLCKKYGEHYAKVHLYVTYHITPIERDITILEDE